MSDTPATAATEAPRKNGMRHFRRAYVKTLLPPDAVARQGSIARIAWEKMRAPGAAIAWLNAHDETLGGRPIDVATQSAEGFVTVETAIAAHPA